MSRALRVSLTILAGCMLGGVFGYLAVTGLSPNRHDRSLEAIMTAFFVTTPIGGALGAIVGFVLTAKRAKRD